MKAKNHNWKKSECSALIKAYSKYPVLYNKIHPNFTSQKDRENALMNIVAELQDARPGTLLMEVKSRIANLRTQYQREKNRIQEAVDRGEEPVVKMWCFIDLQFLEDETKLDDPLETANFRDSTWFPDIDDDSFSESSSVREINGERTNTSMESDNEDLSANNDNEIEELMMNESQSSDEMPTIIVENNLDNSIEKLRKPSKRKHENKLQLSRNASSFEKNSCKNTTDESSPNKNIDIQMNAINIESKLNNLNVKASKVNNLINNLPVEDKQHNRAFVENLLYDLDELDDDVQKRVKWLITNEVYAAYYNLKR